MLITHEREKLLQAINYFVRHTRKCNKIKLFKLLYFLDFEHFKMTGRSVTGLEYNAWKMGPVPVSLFEEMEEPKPDMAKAFDFEQRPINDGFFLKVTPRVEFDGMHFSRREMRLLSELAREHRDTNAEDMIEATHLENLPWDKIYNQLGHKQGPIPYDLAVRPDERVDVMRIANARKELFERLK